MFVTAKVTVTIAVTVKITVTIAVTNCQICFLCYY